MPHTTQRPAVLGRCVQRRMVKARGGGGGGSLTWPAAPGREHCSLCAGALHLQAAALAAVTPPLDIQYRAFAWMSEALLSNICK